MSEDICDQGKHGDLYILTIKDIGDHWLNPILLKAISDAILWVDIDFRLIPQTPSALILTNEGPFFSKGFDPTMNPDEKRATEQMLSTLIRDITSLPLPTIAAVSGNAFGAGMIFALSFDNILMLKAPGHLKLEGVKSTPNWFIPILKSKMSPEKVTQLILGNGMITGEEGVKWKVIKSCHDNYLGIYAEALRVGRRIAITRGDGEVYADNRNAMLSDVLAALEP